MKKIFSLLLLAVIALNAANAASIRTTIDIQADINTSVRIFVEGNDVTNGVISLKLENKAGYMTALTPEFLFIGNATSVSLSLKSPASNGLVSQNGDQMRLKTAWVTPGKTDVTTSFPVRDIPVYATEQEAPPDSGMKVRFTSTERSETYPIGLYSGTYEVIVTPSM